MHIVADDSSPIAAEHYRHSTAPIASLQANPQDRVLTNIQRQTFHTEESGDVVSWFSKNTAVTGGKCILASAYYVYNLLASTRPDLIGVLARADWPFAL